CFLNFALGAIRQYLEIHFARAKYDPLHFIGGTSLGRAENFFESAMDKFFGRRRSKLGAQQTFWRHDDERLNELALHLAPQYMKILGSGSRIADLDIILCARLQKALQPRARMLRALAFVAMREQKHNPARPLPFRFR